MYATVRSYSGSPGLVDALLENEDSVRSLIGAIDGFSAYYLIRTSAGEAVSISVYGDEAGTQASNRAAAEWIGANLPDMAVSPPQVLAGDVVLAF